MAINCEACDDLRTDAPDLMLNGITDKICASLMKNQGVNPNLSVLHTNCEDIKKMIDCFIGGHRDALKAADPCDWKKFIDEMLRNLYVTLEAMGCSDCGQWIEIDNIYKWLEALSGDFTILRKGIDYEITFYNDFTTTSDNVEVGVAVLEDRMIVRTRHVGASTWLRNDKLYQTKLRHSNTITEVPESRMYGIRFIGAYAEWNNFNTMLADEAGATGVWNVNADGVSERNLRASWQGVIAPNKASGSYPIVFAAISYADGWNNQWDMYQNASGVPYQVYTDHINHSVEFTLFK